MWHEKYRGIIESGPRRNRNTMSQTKPTITATPNRAHTGTPSCPLCATNQPKTNYTDGRTKYVDYTLPCIPVPPRVAPFSMGNGGAGAGLTVVLSAAGVRGVKEFDLLSASRVEANIESDTATLICKIPNGSATFHLTKSVLDLTVGVPDEQSHTAVNVFVHWGCAINLCLLGEADVALTVHGKNAAVGIEQRHTAGNVTVNLVDGGMVRIPGFVEWDPSDTFTQMRKRSRLGRVLVLESCHPVIVAAAGDSNHSAADRARRRAYQLVRS
jgi:hypothetical protein